MRIIAGRLRGRRLLGPKNLPIRPTTNRVKEALYALIEVRITVRDARLLDLFSGTGALALEGISRGAQSAVFVERSWKALDIARKNAEHLNVEQKCHFLCADAVTYLKRHQGFLLDIIVADPPYEFKTMIDLPDLALSCLRPGGLFVIEHDARTQFLEHSSLDTTRGYGRTRISIFRN